jgi:hypothetical protein
LPRTPLAVVVQLLLEVSLARMGVPLAFSASVAPFRNSGLAEGVDIMAEEEPFSPAAVEDPAMPTAPTFPLGRV